MSISLTEAVLKAIETRLNTIHTAIPGIVQSYDAGKASIQPCIKEDGRALPVIPSVPVIFPRTLTTIIHFPINKGDSGLLIFAERSLDVWLHKGGTVDPDDPRILHLSDAVFLPGLLDFTQPIEVEDSDALTIKHQDQSITIASNGNISIGASSLRKLVNDAFQDLFNNHRHNFMGFVGTGTPTPGVTTTPVSADGVGAPRVPDSPGFVYLAAEMNDTHLTEKVSAQ